MSKNHNALDSLQRGEGTNSEPIERQELMSKTINAGTLMNCYRGFDFCPGHTIDDILRGHYFHSGELHREEVDSASSDASSAFSTATEQTGIKLIVSVDEDDDDRVEFVIESCWWSESSDAVAALAAYSRAVQAFEPIIAAFSVSPTPHQAAA